MEDFWINISVGVFICAFICFVSIYKCFSNYTLTNRNPLIITIIPHIYAETTKDIILQDVSNHNDIPIATIV